MITLLKCEYKKTRGKYIFLTALVIIIFAGVFSFYNKSSGSAADFMIKNGYLMNLYQLPLINAIMLPLLATIIASRLCDIEHKGKNFKQICTLTEKGKLFDAKLIYGLAITALSVILLWCATLVYSKIRGFGGEIPIKLYLLYLLFTLVPTCAIYIFQHSLSMIFANKAIPFFAGILGEFAGLFSMFLPNLPWFRRSLLWGYYGVLQFVGLFGWTKETRYDTAYFEIMDIDRTGFTLLIAATVIIYIAGKIIFCRKEI